MPVTAQAALPESEFEYRYAALMAADARRVRRRWAMNLNRQQLGSNGDNYRKPGAEKLRQRAAIRRQQVLDAIIDRPGITRNEIAARMVGLCEQGVHSYLRSLKAAKLIRYERVGQVYHWHAA